MILRLEFLIPLLGDVARNKFIGEVVAHNELLLSNDLGKSNLKQNKTN
jgi:hypothetical protein